MTFIILYEVDLAVFTAQRRAIPCGDYSSSFKPRDATPSPICHYFNIVGSHNTSFDTGWSCVSGVCSKSLEFPASSCQRRAFAARLPPRIQNWNVRAVLPCRLIDSQTLSAHYTAVLHIQTVNCSSLIYVTSDIVRWSLIILFLFQRLSVLIQRYNSVLILESFCSDEDPDL